MTDPDVPLFRMAMPFSEEILGMVAQLTGIPNEELVPVDMYVIIEVISPTEFKGSLVSKEILEEEQRRDENLEILSP